MSMLHDLCLTRGLLNPPVLIQHDPRRVLTRGDLLSLKINASRLVMDWLTEEFTITVGEIARMMLNQRWADAEQWAQWGE